MKARLMMIASALIASLTCPSAGAQPGSGMGGMDNGTGSGMAAGPMQGGTPRAGSPRDCGQAPNPAACSAHRDARAKAWEACKSAVAPQRKQCMKEQMQNIDCARAGNPQQCEARKQSLKECQGQAGPAFRQCMQRTMPPVDCSKAPNPARCEQHQKARAACQDKVGPEHKACLREQFNVK